MLAAARRLAARAIFPELPRHDAALGQVGIQLQGNEMRWAAALQQRGGRFRLTQCEFRPLSRPADPAGSVHQILMETGLLKAQCNYVLDSAEYQLLLVEAPDVPDSELREALRWRIREMIDFPIDEAVLDVFDMPRAPGAATHMMYVVACRNALVAQKVALFSRDAERLEVIDVAELALRNLLGLLDEDRNGVALLHLKPDSGLLLISRDSTLHLCRRILAGWQNLETEGAEPDMSQTGVRNTAFEVVRSLEFYEHQFKQPPVGTLYLAPGPGLERLDEVCTRLGEATGLPARPLNLDALLDSDVPLTPERQARCLFAIGAALRQEATTL